MSILGLEIKGMKGWGTEGRWGGGISHHHITYNPFPKTRTESTCTLIALWIINLNRATTPVHPVWCVWRSLASPSAPWTDMYIFYHPQRDFLSVSTRITLSLWFLEGHGLEWHTSANSCNGCVDVSASIKRLLFFVQICFPHGSCPKGQQENESQCIYVYILSSPLSL